MTDAIHIGSVTVPLVDYAIGASAILGIRDSGKTVTSKGIAEQLLEHKIPIVVFDAVGKWRWMKVAAEHSRGKAYKVVVAGGREPDLPLTPHSVPEIVRAALKERIPLIIDLFSKDMSKSDWRRIVQTAIHIIHYENEGGAVHVFLEEAAEFVPQKIYDGETYAEIEKLVRMGGNASVGITLINQRSQEVNKAVLDNCSTALVLGCQVGKNAIEAVEKWIERLDPPTAKEVTTSLPKLQSGEAWVWTRKSLDKPSCEKMPMCRSFHPDRRTPEIVLKSAKPTDTAEFVAKMANSIPRVIEEAKNNDPTELKKRITQLSRELEKAKIAVPPQVQIEEVPTFTQSDEIKIRNVTEKFDEVKRMLERAVVKLPVIEELIGKISRPIAPVVAKPLPRPQPIRQIRPTSKAVQPPAQVGDLTISKTQQRILDALAWFESIGTPEPTNLQVGAIALIDATGGHFSNTVGPLSTAGLVDRGNGVMSLTDAGRECAQVPDNLTTLGEYHDMLRDRVRRARTASGKTVEMLNAIIEAGGEVPTEAVGEAVGIDHTGGHFSNTIGPLGTLGLIERRNGIIYPTEILFPSALTS